jgi:hypothetical protein
MWKEVGRLWYRLENSTEVYFNGDEGFMVTVKNV